MFLKEEVLTTKGRPDLPDFPDIPDFSDVLDLPIIAVKQLSLIALKQ